ncbi:MAG: hypothetical protein RIS64_4241 [Bacteroidota bacterium]|jgi:glycosyltransferase involved in cell wall biosynthesis
MKVLNISAAHPYKTAGIVVADCHQMLRDHQYESKILTIYAPESNDKNVISYQNFFENRFESYSNRFLGKFFPKTYNTVYYYEGSDETIPKYNTKSIIRRLNGFQPDVIIVYFIYGFVNIQNIYELSKYWNVPVFWYLMDMRAMTGGCAYTWACEGYQNQCGKCPAIASTEANDITAKNLAYAKNLVAQMDLTLIIASEQLRLEASKSSLFRDKKFYKIFCPINDAIFNSEQYDRPALKVKYKSVSNKRTLLIGAVSLKEKRKGFHLLLGALEKLIKEQDVNVELLVAGHVSEVLKATLQSFVPKVTINYLGYLNYNQLAEVFNITDAFISTSVMDSGPMMINQSILCGTPVIAFDIGIAKDLVVSGKTGYKMDEINENALFQAILDFLKLSEGAVQQLRRNCIELGKQELTSKVIGDKIDKMLRSNLQNVSK